jgi:chemotaxis response regulator CheB
MLPRCFYWYGIHTCLNLPLFSNFDDSVCVNGTKQMAQPIRVVVANQPRLMRELVLETITEQPDIEIVAEIQNENDILRAVEDAHPDFLIIALDESGRRPAICDTLLARYPNIKILALAPERNLSIFFWASLDIHSIEVEASQAGILNTLRQERQLAGGKTCA